MVSGQILLAAATVTCKTLIIVCASNYHPGGYISGNMGRLLLPQYENLTILPTLETSVQTSINNKNRVVTYPPPGFSGNQFNVGRQYHVCMGGWPPMQAWYCRSTLN